MDVAKALADIDKVLVKPPLKQGVITDEDAHAACTSRRACIHRYAPPRSTYREDADRRAADLARNGPHDTLITLGGVLQGLRADLAAGRLGDFEELVRADVLGDLLAQASSLNREHYRRAAAVLAGAALEEHVKKLATKHGTGTTKPDGSPKKASVINAELKTASVYAETQRAQIEAWQKLRNEAAHGEPGFEAVPPAAPVHSDSDVQRMIDGVGDFVTRYPA